MRTQVNEEENLVLDTILSLTLYPKDSDAGEDLPITFENIQKRGLAIHKWILNNQSKLIDTTKIIEKLLQKKLIKKDDKTFALTKKGKPYAVAARVIRTGKKYNVELVRSEESNAYSTFCERAFGLNLCQANMMAMDQLEKLLLLLNLSEKNRVLDMGCGVGRIAEYISDATGASVLGIDIATEVIKRAQMRTREKRVRLKFQLYDFNNLKFKPASFDTIIAIATMHFVFDLEKTIGQMKKILHPNGQMGLFTFQYCFENDSPELLLPNNTHLAQVLKKYDLSFQAFDFTQSEINLLQKELKFANELKNEFEVEGNLDLYKDLIEEAETDLSRLQAGQKRVYLYHVKQR